MKNYVLIHGNLNKHDFLEAIISSELWKIYKILKIVLPPVGSETEIALSKLLACEVRGFGGPADVEAPRACTCAFTWASKFEIIKFAISFNTFT